MCKVPAAAILVSAVMQICSGQVPIIPDDAPEIDCVKDCPDEYQPVCGSDGIIYDNDCKLKQASCLKASLFKMNDGKCDSGRQPCVWTCDEKYQPICGSDGSSYTNQCALDYANCKDASVTGVYQGECEEVITQPSTEDVETPSSTTRNGVITDAAEEPTTISFLTDDEDTVEQRRR